MLAAQQRIRREIIRGLPMGAGTGGPREIGSNEELRELFRAGSGYIYNVFYRKLHTADCRYVEGMTVGERKIFYPDLDAVRQEPESDFNSCPNCLPL